MGGPRAAAPGHVGPPVTQPVRTVRVDGKHPDVRALHKELFPADAHPDYSAGDWWLLYVGAELAGFAGLHSSVQWGDAGYLVRSGVRGKFRGKGLQRRLIRLRERQARARGWKWAITSTYDNHASANNLIACGYRLYEPQRPWGAKGTLYWRRQLKD